MNAPVASPTAPNPPAPTDPTDAELLSRFESLGIGCEFGFAQRFAGVETLALFRFALVPTAALLDAFRSDFHGIDDPDRIEIACEPRTHEWFGRVDGYGFVFHTGRFGPDIAAADLHARLGPHLAFLRDLLRERLADGSRIFIRSGPPEDEPAIRALAALIAARGPATLVWAKPATASRPGGTVERLGPNLLCATIDRFWRDTGTAFEILMPQWLSVCANALAMTGPDPGPGSNPAPPLLPPVGRFPRPNLMRLAGPRAAGPVARSIALPWETGASAHVLTAPAAFPDAQAETARIETGLRPDTVHVFALDLWIPHDFAGPAAVALFVGLPALRHLPADLARREVWQTVWTVARIPTGAPVMLALSVEGTTGDGVLSRRWRLEAGSSLLDDVVRPD